MRAFFMIYYDVLSYVSSENYSELIVIDFKQYQLHVFKKKSFSLFFRII
jgi:hypothetical protein